MASIGSLSATLSLNSVNFTSGLSRAVNSLQGFGQSVKGSFTSIGVVANDAFGAASLAAGLAVSKVVEFGKAAVGAASEMEDLRLSFQGIVGGAEQAADLVGQISKFAAETPFETQGLAQSVKLLANMGFEAQDAIEIIKELGDVIAASGSGTEGLNRVALALGQIKMAGVLHGQDANQLINAGIPIWDALAKRIGTTAGEVRKLSESGAIDASTAILSVLDVAKDPKFAGAQDRLSKSVSGMFSTLKDNIKLTMSDLGEIIVEAIDLKSLVGRVTDFVASIRDMRGPIISTFEDITISVNALLNVLKKIGSYVLEFVVSPILQAGEKISSTLAEIVQPIHLLPGMNVNPLASDTMYQTLRRMADVHGAANKAALEKAAEWRDLGLTAGTGKIVDFFQGLKDKLAPALPIFGPQNKLDVGGAAAPLTIKEMKLAPGALAGTAEAISLANKSILAQSGAGGQQVPDLLKNGNKAVQDNGKLLKDIIIAMKDNGIGLLGEA